MEYVDLRIQFIFFFVAAVCFFMAAFKEDWPPGWSHRRHMALGWLLFAVPFVVNAARGGW